MRDVFVSPCTVRERTHRSINDSTNQRGLLIHFFWSLFVSLVVMWAVFEAFVLVSMTLGQIYYLKRFFESRFVV